MALAEREELRDLMVIRWVCQFQDPDRVWDMLANVSRIHDSRAADPQLKEAAAFLAESDATLREFLQHKYSKATHKSLLCEYLLHCKNRHEIATALKPMMRGEALDDHIDHIGTFGFHQPAYLDDCSDVSEETVIEKIRSDAPQFRSIRKMEGAPHNWMAFSLGDNKVALAFLPAVKEEVRGVLSLQQQVHISIVCRDTTPHYSATFSSWCVLEYVKLGANDERSIAEIKERFRKAGFDVRKLRSADFVTQHGQTRLFNTTTMQVPEHLRSFS